MKRFSRVNSDCAFTLIELLIAIAVSGIVLAGLVSIFTTSSRAYKRQDETATLQQNLRVAKINLERDIRMAGCGFGTVFNYLSGANPNRLYPLANTNADPPANSDSLTIRYVNYSDPCSRILPQLTPSNNAGDIVFAAGATATIRVINDMNSTEYSKWKTTPSSPCTNGQFLAVYTRSEPEDSSTLRSDVFSITGIVGQNIQCSNLINTDRNNIERVPPTQIKPPLNSSINFFSATQLVNVTYSYNSTLGTLERNGQALVENIEELQFAFGLDTDADGDVDSWIFQCCLDSNRTNPGSIG